MWRGVGIINRCKELLPKNIKLQLYNSLINSHLLYGIELWGGLPNSVLKPLKILQKRALRAIMNAPSDHIFKQLKILSLDQIYQ